jgi:transcriptional regulator of aromatic amino acid metabolism
MKMEGVFLHNKRMIIEKNVIQINWDKVVEVYRERFKINKNMNLREVFKREYNRLNSARKMEPILGVSHSSIYRKMKKMNFKLNRR